MRISEQMNLRGKRTTKTKPYSCTKKNRITSNPKMIAAILPKRRPLNGLDKASFQLNEINPC